MKVPEDRSWAKGILVRLATFAYCLALGRERRRGEGAETGGSWRDSAKWIGGTPRGRQGAAEVCHAKVLYIAMSSYAIAIT